MIEQRHVDAAIMTRSNGINIAGPRTPYAVQIVRPPADWQNRAGVCPICAIFMIKKRHIGISAVPDSIYITRRGTPYAI
jgi:hypothetical protein